MKKRLICFGTILLLCFGFAHAQTVRIGNVTNQFSPTQLLASRTITLDIIYEAGSASPGTYIYSNAFILHGTANWGSLTSTRLELCQREIVTFFTIFSCPVRGRRLEMREQNRFIIHSEAQNICRRSDSWRMMRVRDY